jgi:diphosphomevalonate decarboxylase
VTAEATAVAHPNIALVKYWGKADVEQNLPAAGSLSITLDTLTTTTRVRLDDALREDRFRLDGEVVPEAAERAARCLDLIRERLGVAFRADVETHNTFPTAAGLASSASGFAALVVAADRAAGAGLERSALASLARRCSGSAARSLYGGFVTLELADGGRGNPEVRQIAPAAAWPLEVVVAVTTRDAKAVGSSAGMARSAATSPFYRAWVEGAARDLDEARGAVERRDFGALAEVSEHNCLKMHGVMTSSRPPLLYWSAGTLACVQRVRELRASGLGVFFTIDAGPQVKAVCLPGMGERVAASLAGLPGVLQVMRAGLGEGARVIQAKP